MSKEFALEKLFGNRATIDGHKVGSGSDRLVMEGAREQLFARTAFACDQNGGIGVGNCRKQAS
jgi:hypothetical protein